MKIIWNEPEDLKTAVRVKWLWMACPDEWYWPLARPENAKSLRWRIKAAWQVLRGRAVPVEWF